MNLQGNTRNSKGTSRYMHVNYLPKAKMWYASRVRSSMQHTFTTKVAAMEKAVAVLSNTGGGYIVVHGRNGVIQTNVAV